MQPTLPHTAQSFSSIADQYGAGTPSPSTPGADLNRPPSQPLAPQSGRQPAPSGAGGRPPVHPGQQQTPQPPRIPRPPSAPAQGGPARPLGPTHAATFSGGGPPQQPPAQAPPVSYWHSYMGGYGAGASQGYGAYGGQGFGGGVDPSRRGSDSGGGDRRTALSPGPARAGLQKQGAPPADI